MRKRIATEVLSPGVPEKRLDDLLVFDARCTDVKTGQELARLWPQLRQIRRAWSAHFEQYGCIACGDGKARLTQKSDRAATLSKAGELRRQGMKWDAIFEVVGLNLDRTSKAERKKFQQLVWWRMAHPPQRETWQRSGHGGFCWRCYQRIRKELLGIVRKMDEGRDPERDTAALTRRFDVARQLLNGGAE